MHLRHVNSWQGFGCTSFIVHCDSGSEEYIKADANTLYFIMAYHYHAKPLSKDRGFNCLLLSI